MRAVATISILPSPSISPAYTPRVLVPVVRSTLVAKDDEDIVPGVAVFRNTDTELELLLETARSVLPSPSKSAATTFTGVEPVANVTAVPNDKEPTVEVLRNTETVFEVLTLLVTARSGLPSPS